MVMLYFLGVFASYLLVLKRENKRFPWKAFGLYLGIALLLIAIVLFIAIYRYHFKIVLHSPFLVR
jgi:sec-independent protein translocase protein TatC